MTERPRTNRPDSWRRNAARIAVGLLTAIVAGCGPAIGTLSSGGGGTTATTAATTSTASNTLSGWLHTSGSKIEDASNHVVTVRAVAWFGMETSNCAPHGLWTINLDLRSPKFAASASTPFGCLTPINA